MDREQAEPAKPLVLAKAEWHGQGGHKKNGAT